MDEASKDGFARQSRREVLAALALALGGAVRGHAAEIHGALPWIPEQTQPPEPVSPGGWRYFTADEAATVEALVDRLIPPDPEFPGGKDAGCAVFIDRQLAGPYGVAEGQYTTGPFHDGTKEQGPQSPVDPRDHYRKSLAALDEHCCARWHGRCDPWRACSGRPRKLRVYVSEAEAEFGPHRTRLLTRKMHQAVVQGLPAEAGVGNGHGRRYGISPPRPIGL